MLNRITQDTEHRVRVRVRFRVRVTLRIRVRLGLGLGLGLGFELGVSLRVRRAEVKTRQVDIQDKGTYKTLTRERQEGRRGHP